MEFNWKTIGMWVLAIGAGVHLILGIPFLNTLIGGTLSPLIDISLFGFLSIQGLIGLIGLVSLWMSRKS